MFTISELSQCLSEPWFLQGYQRLERNLLLQKLGISGEPLSRSARQRLKRFSQAVISSAASWQNPRSDGARSLCQLAGDIEASLSLESESDASAIHVSHLKAVLLYELAGLAGASASHAARNGFDPRFREFFTRETGSIWRSVTTNPSPLPDRTDLAPASADGDASALFEQSLGEVLREAGGALQISGADSVDHAKLGLLGKIAGEFSFGLTGDDVLALEKLLALRAANSSLSLVPRYSHLTTDDLRAISAPMELWPAQVEALEGGLLNPEMRSFGFAAPTGTGKTALTRILIANALRSNPGGKVLYISPSRALVHEIWKDLSDSLGGMGIRTFEAGGHLTSHETLSPTADEADVLVFTPERADLLLRVDPDFLAKTALVVVDEAHHIEQGSRGILLELYLWRLMRMVSSAARIVQLSAVAPNISDLTEWLSLGRDSRSIMIDWRTSRLRVGVLERSARGAGILKFGESAPYIIFKDGELSRDPVEGLGSLANRMAENGIVLVLCMSPGTAEKVAKSIAALRPKEQSVEDDVSERLDAWVERELYPESELRTYYKKRVLFHHAQMPPRVRLGIEEAIRAKKVDVICATTTLAEGVNFPFSTVIVESLVARDYQLSPRALWNIAGRAGRFGVDSEGHCILYRPELWAKNLTGYDITDYLRTALADIPPVKSALAHGMENLSALVSAKKISLDDLESISLSEIRIDGKATREAKNVRSLINILRVGYAHASSTRIVDIKEDDAPEYRNELLAARQLIESDRAFAEQIGEQQRRVIRRATNANPALVEIAAKVGWSLESQDSIYSWLKTREDWQLEQFGNLVLGGYIRNSSHVGYLIGPVAKYLLAFDGEALGGAYSFLAEKWMAGIPPASFQAERGSVFGKMVSRIYGRMQYLLPWGLFGMHELLLYEAKRRHLTIGDGVSSLSVLAAEGVPNFDALTLVLSLGLERADATRLSEAFKPFKSRANVTDWVASLSWPEAERIVRGADQRRVDPFFRVLHRRLVMERQDQNPTG